MKKLILSIAMITFMAGTVSVSFGQEQVKQSHKTMDSMKMDPMKMDHMKMEKNVVVMPEQELVKIDSAADYQKLTVASEVRFTENDKSIADLKLNNTTLDVTKKTAKSKEIDLLEQQNIALKKELDLYKDNGKADWKTFKKQFNSDMDKLTEDLKNLKTLATL